MILVLPHAADTYVYSIRLTNSRILPDHTWRSKSTPRSSSRDTLQSPFPARTTPAVFCVADRSDFLAPPAEGGLGLF